jgi:hypothetical protein
LFTPLVAGKQLRQELTAPDPCDRSHPCGQLWGGTVPVPTTLITEKDVQVSFFSLDQLVPEDHLVRKIENAIDFTFIYDLVQDKYSETGRPSIDPVVLIKNRADLVSLWHSLHVSNHPGNRDQRGLPLVYRLRLHPTHPSFLDLWEELYPPFP